MYGVTPLSVIITKIIAVQQTLEMSSLEELEANVEGVFLLEDEESSEHEDHV